MCSSVVWRRTLLMPEFYRSLQSTAQCITPRLRSCTWPRWDDPAGCILTNAESSYICEVWTQREPAVFPEGLIWPSLIQTLLCSHVTTAAALETSKLYTGNLGESSHLLQCILAAMKFCITLHYNKITELVLVSMQISDFYMFIWWPFNFLCISCVCVRAQMYVVEYIINIFLNS